MYSKGVFFDHFIEFARFSQNGSRRVFGVVELKDIVKIELGPFTGALEPIFAQNFGPTQGYLIT